MSDKKFVITEQEKTFRRYTLNYKVSERKKFSIRYNVGDVEFYLKKKTADKKGNYILTSHKEVDELINYALKKDYTIFNENNNNYRVLKFNNIGNFEIYKIRELEYFIEQNEREDGEVSISISNYLYSYKWLTILDKLLENYNFGSFKGFKEDIIIDAKNKNIFNIDDIATSIESIFNHCLDFHNNDYFEGINHRTKRYDVLGRPVQRVAQWKQYKEGEIIDSTNSLLFQLNELFLHSYLNEFLQVRDLTTYWINKIINETSKNKKRTFQWGYSPFMNDVFNLPKKLNKMFSDKKIKLKNNLQNTNKTPLPETIDLSNSKGTEKVIMLKQLGILDFLREQEPFNASKNALASALSGITGIKSSTLQSYINQ